MKLNIMKYPKVHVYFTKNTNTSFFDIKIYQIKNLIFYLFFNTLLKIVIAFK